MFFQKTLHSAIESRVTATHRNTPQLTILTNCITLQLILTYCNSLQLVVAHCNAPQLIATHRNSLQPIVTRRNSLQLIATHCSSLKGKRLKADLVFEPVVSRSRVTCALRIQKGLYSCAEQRLCNTLYAHIHIYISMHQHTRMQMSQAESQKKSGDMGHSDIGWGGND